MSTRATPFSRTERFNTGRHEPVSPPTRRSSSYCVPASSPDPCCSLMTWWSPRCPTCSRLGRQSPDRSASSPSDSWCIDGRSYRRARGPEIKYIWNISTRSQCFSFRIHVNINLMTSYWSAAGCHDSVWSIRSEVTETGGRVLTFSSSSRWKRSTWIAWIICRNRHFLLHDE